MNATTSESFFAGSIALVLLGVATYYAWRSLQTLRNPKPQDGQSPEDRGYARAQAWRRLANSGLMVLMAGLLVAYYGYSAARHEDAGTSANEKQIAADQPAGTPDAAQKQRSFEYFAFWMFFCVILLAIISLALFEFLAIRRYGLRHYRKIQADRREMLEQEVARLRSERNGH